MNKQLSDARPCDMLINGLFPVFLFQLADFFLQSHRHSERHSLQTFTKVSNPAAWLAGERGSKVTHLPLHSFSGASCTRSTS